MSFSGTHERLGQGDDFVSALKEFGHRQLKPAVRKDDGGLSTAHFLPVTTKEPRSLLRPAAPWNCDSLLKLGLWSPRVHLLPLTSCPRGKGSLVGPTPNRSALRSPLSRPLGPVCCLDSWPWRNLSRLTSDPWTLDKPETEQPGRLPDFLQIRP